MQKLQIDSDAFNALRRDFDLMLDKVLNKMLDKGANEGKLTLTLNIELDNARLTDPETGETYMATVPAIGHKIKTSIAMPADSVQTVTVPPEFRLVQTRSGFMLEPKDSAQTSFFDEDE